MYIEREKYRDIILLKTGRTGRNRRKPKLLTPLLLLNLWIIWSCQAFIAKPPLFHY